MLFIKQLVQFTQDELNITGFGIKNDTQRSTGLHVFLSKCDTMVHDLIVACEDYTAHLHTDNAILLSLKRCLLIMSDLNFQFDQPSKHTLPNSLT